MMNLLRTANLAIDFRALGEGDQQHHNSAPRAEKFTEFRTTGQGENAQGAPHESCGFRVTLKTLGWRTQGNPGERRGNFFRNPAHEGGATGRPIWRVL
jgi:hypothetical protein